MDNEDVLAGVDLVVDTRTPQARAHAEIKEQLAPELAKKVVYDGNPNVAGGIAKISYTHEDMIDFILAHPHVKQKTLAERYGYTESWVSRIISSDAFRAMYAKRRDEVVDPTVLQEVEERFRALTLRSLDVVMAKLEDVASPTMDAALKALEVSSRAQGYGVAKGVGVTVNQSFVVALPAKSTDGKSWLADHGPPVIDVTPSSA